MSNLPEEPPPAATTHAHDHRETTMAEDSVSAHVAQQQKKWEEYLAAHGVEKLYRDMTAELIATMPESPVKFMYEYLAKHYPEVLEGEAAAAPAADDGAGGD